MVTGSLRIIHKIDIRYTREGKQNKKLNLERDLRPGSAWWRKRWDSNPRAREGYLISSLLVILSRSGSFVSVSGRFV